MSKKKYIIIISSLIVTLLISVAVYVLVISPKSRVTLHGTMECLTHKPDPVTGTKTLACEMGMKAEDGKQYNLRWPDGHDPMETDSYMGDKITVKGILSTPSDIDENTSGAVKVESIERR